MVCCTSHCIVPDSDCPLGSDTNTAAITAGILVPLLLLIAVIIIVVVIILRYRNNTEDVCTKAIKRYNNNNMIVTNIDRTQNITRTQC